MTTQIRDADLHEINQILSRVLDPSDATKVIVTGFNVQRANIGSAIITQDVAMPSHSSSGIVAVAGNATSVGYGFSSFNLGTGIYASEPNTVNIASAGVNVAAFSHSSGIGVTKLYSPNGVIDCQHTAFINVSQIEQDAYYYKLATATPLLTQDDTLTSLLQIPLDPLVDTHNVVLHVIARVACVNTSNIEISAERTFKFKIMSIHNGAITSSPIHTMDYYGATALNTTNVSLRLVGASFYIACTGLAATELSWSAGCDIIRNEF